MTKLLSRDLVTRLHELVVTKMGLHYPRERLCDLERGIRSAARDFGFTDAEECARWLLSAPLTRQQIDILAGHLTIGETYFFRHAESFLALEQHVLPALIQARRSRGKRLRIWNAACCTGEEPYSLAMLLHRLLPDLQEWDISILATDINARFLDAARSGVYGEWSFRGVPEWIKERYFTRMQDGSYRLHAPVKRMVTFAYHNLAEDAYPPTPDDLGQLDLILCRNAMIYFTQTQVKAMLEGFHRALCVDGWLITSPVETSFGLNSHFVLENFHKASFFRKAAVPTHRRQIAVRPPSPVAELPTAYPPATPLPAPVPRMPLPVSNPVHAKGTPTESRPGTATEVTLDRARALYQQAKYQEAKTILERLLAEEQSPDGQTAALLARIHANLGDAGQAITWCERALAADKVNASVHYLYATILLEQGRQPEAMAALKRVLFLAHDHVMAYYTLGLLEQGGHRQQEAIRHFRNAQQCLARYSQDEPLAESDGLTAGRLAAMIAHLMPRGER